MMKYLITFILVIFSLYTIESYALSEDSIKLYPEQEQVCDTMSTMAYEIQLERRLQSLDKFPPTANENMNGVAEWVYGKFTTIITPSEVKSRVFSDCTAVFQRANEEALDV